MDPTLTPARVLLVWSPADGGFEAAQSAWGEVVAAPTTGRPLAVHATTSILADISDYDWIVCGDLGTQHRVLRHFPQPVLARKIHLLRPAGPLGCPGPLGAALVREWVARWIDGRHAAVPDPPPNAELDAWAERRKTVLYLKADLDLPDDLLRAVRDERDYLEPRYRESVERACRRVLGRSVTAEPLAQQGTFHRVFRVTGSGAPLVFRGNAAGWHADLGMHLDPWVTGRLHADGLPAVGVSVVDTSRTVWQYEYQLLEEVTARPLSDYHGDTGRLFPLLTKLGAFCARVHQIEMSGFGFLDVRPLLAPNADARTPPPGVHRTWRDHVCGRLEDHLRRCSQNGSISPAEVDQIFAVFDANAALLASAPSRLLHGDPGSHNVLTDGTEIVALLDWEDALAGDPMYDVAFWATFHPDDRLAMFLDGYRSVAPLPVDYERRLWLYYLRIALAKTVVRERLGYADQPGRPPAADRIRNALRACRGYA